MKVFRVIRRYFLRLSRVEADDADNTGQNNPNCILNVDFFSMINHVGLTNGKKKSYQGEKSDRLEYKEMLTMGRQYASVRQEHKFLSSDYS